MGCGSSSTSVQTFKDPEATKHNSNYQRQQSTLSRQSGSKTHQTNGAASSSPHVPSRQPSATSTSSKKINARQSPVNSAYSRRSSRENSANTRNTYTLERRNSRQSNNEVLVTQVNNDTETQAHDENQNIDAKQERDAINAEQERQKEEARKQYEEIQNQTFLTDNSKEAQEPDSKVDKAARHEEIARVKEVRRANFNPNTAIQEAIEEYKLSPLLIPEMDAERTIENYTMDDVVEHNGEVGSEDWFKYGRKIYSYEKMKPLFQARFAELKETVINPYMYKYTDAESMGHKNIVYAREFMITRAELSQMLAACHVGNCVDINRDEYMARMKQSVEYVLEDPGDSEYMNDYKAQLSRWLSAYPYSKVDNDKIDVNVDANEQTFPLPSDIKANPCVLRKWIETWQAFDLEVPDEGCWRRLTPLDVDWGDANEAFAEVVQTGHDDNTLDPLDMTVDGDVAWIEIEIDLFKNDVTTPDQDAVWRTRASRTNLDDPEWKADRRKKLGEAMKARYENCNMKYDLEEHARFAELLEEHWKIFQELCEKEFNPPPPRKVRSTEVKKDNNHDLSDIQENGDTIDAQETNRDGNMTVRDNESIRSNNSRPGSQTSVASGSKRKELNGTMVNGSVLGDVQNESLTEQSQNGDADLGDTLRKEKDTDSVRSGSRPGSKTSLSNKTQTQERPGSKSSTNRRESNGSVKTTPMVNGNESGRKSTDLLELDGEDGNANGVPDRGSTTETMDSGLELDNFDNTAKS